MGLENKSVSSFLSTMLRLTSKKLTDYLDFSCVNFNLGWKLLRRFRNPSSLSSSCVQMKNMSFYIKYYINYIYINITLIYILINTILILIITYYKADIAIQ